jgi:chromosome segregation ATPase
MKKKMLFMAAIAGLISLGSCVKDDVSGSVEAVRNAKANQLNADANLKNAQAAVQQAAAELAKATQSALVAQEQANAAILQAQAKAAEMRNEVTAAALEDEIANAIADFKQQLAGNQTALQNNLNAFDAALRTAKIREYAELQRLTSDYANAYAALNAAQATLLGDMLALDGAKENYEYAMKSKENQINANKKQIEQNEKLIEKLTELKAKIEAGASAEELAAEAQAMNTATDIEAAAFGGSAEVQALIKASEDLAAAYFAYKLYTADTALGDAFDGAFTKLNNEVAAKGWTSMIDGSAINEYYVTSAGAAIKSGDLMFGVVDDYSYDMTVTPRVAAVSYAGATMANIVPNVYKASEGAALRFDDYVNNYAKTAKNTLAAEKKNLADEEEYLGTTSDAKDKKTAKTNKLYPEVLTVYATKALATENKAKADEKASTTKADYDKAAAALAKAKTDLAAAYKAVAAKPTNTTLQDAVYDAKVAFAQAIEEVFGEATDLTYVKKSAWTEGYFDKWILGTDTPGAVMTASDNGVAANYEKFDTVKEINAWLQANAGGTFEDLDGDSVDDLDDDGNKILATFGNHDTANSSKKAYEDAAAAAKAAATALSNANKAIDPQIKRIADQKDKVAAAQETADDADGDVEELKALLAACDLDAYAEVVAAGAEAAAAFNEAAAAAVAAQDAIDDKYAEAAAIAGAWTTDIDDQIKQAEDDIAAAEQAIKNWESANSQVQLVAAAEAQVEADKAAVIQAKIDLDAAKAALEAAVGSIDIDPEEEPAEEPSEEPSEEPAEGGEETPAEGEGEAEGGEEA